MVKLFLAHKTWRTRPVQQTHLHLPSSFRINIVMLIRGRTSGHLERHPIAHTVATTRAWRSAVSRTRGTASARRGLFESQTRSHRRRLRLSERIYLTRASWVRYVPTRTDTSRWRDSSLELVIAIPVVLNPLFSEHCFLDFRRSLLKTTRSLDLSVFTRHKMLERLVVFQLMSTLTFCCSSFLRNRSTALRRARAEHRLVTAASGPRWYACDENLLPNAVTRTSTAVALCFRERHLIKPILVQVRCVKVRCAAIRRDTCSFVRLARRRRLVRFVQPVGGRTAHSGTLLSELPW